MRKWSAALWLLLLGCGSTSAPTTAIRNVYVVDVADGTVRAAQTVLIEGNRIVAVGPAETLRVPVDADVIEGDGSYLIPGLWDMHAHHFRSPDGLEAELMRHVTNGVLGVRDLGIPLDSIPRLREVAANSAIPAPRVWFSGPLLESTDIYSSMPGRIPVSDTTAARRAVETLAAAGVTFIKVHDLVSPEIYLSAARAAKSHGLAVVGHVPVTMTTDQVIDAGQRSIEHLGQLHAPFAECSENGQIDREASARLLTDVQYYTYFLNTNYLGRLLTAFDVDRCKDLARRLAEAKMWQVPTLVIWQEWAEGVPWFPPGLEKHLREALSTAMRVTAIFNEAGVPIMTGTDNVGTVHDELVLLVDAGLSPLRALQAATLHPATFLEKSHELGTVEPGKLADLVLLDGNPLDNITNTQKIRAVVADGRLYRRADLDRVLTELDSASAAR